MVENVLIGEWYIFQLKDKSFKEGKVVYKDEDVITLMNDSLGEVEFKVKDVILVEPCINLSKDVLLDTSNTVEFVIDKVKELSYKPNLEQIVKDSVNRAVSEIGQEVESITIMNDEFLIKVKDKN